MRHAPSVAVLKKRALVEQPPLSAKSVFGIHGPKGLIYLTQLRTGVSKLKFHKFMHNSRDTVNPMCPKSDGIEDTEHFMLPCPSFYVQRQNFLTGIVKLLRPVVQIAELSNNALTQLLSYGIHNHFNDLNKSTPIDFTLYPRNWSIGSHPSNLSIMQPPSSLI